MNTSKAGLNLIREFEGLSLQSYYCPAGRLTIGYGSTQNVGLGQKITQAQADKLLADDLAEFEKAIAQLVKVPLSQNQFDALVSFTYNCGISALAKSTLLKKLNLRDYNGAAAEFKRWDKANGKPLLGLTKRRYAETKLFLGANV